MIEFDWSGYEKIHKGNNDGKYKDGDYVIFTNLISRNSMFSEFEGKTCKVLASNYVDGSVEYLLEGFPYLVWEGDLREVLTSASPDSCQDYCQYDSGHNCNMCDRFSNTKFYRKEKAIYFSCNPYMPKRWQFTEITWWKDLFIWIRELIRR